MIEDEMEESLLNILVKVYSVITVHDFLSLYSII